QRALVVDPVSHFEAVPGHGVQATVGGRAVLVGNGKLLERNGVTPGLEREAEGLRAEAKTALYVAVDGRTFGLIAVADRIRPAALVLARRVQRKIKQNLFWAAIYNLIAIPLAAGVLYPSLGILLKPAWAALAMSASTVTVTVNALLLRPLEHPPA